MHPLRAAEGWSSIATGTFTAAYGLSYVVSALFMAFFLSLLVFQGAVTKAAGIYDQLQQQKRMAELNTLATGSGAQQPLQS